MADSWERRVLPYVPGWNNAPVTGPQFTVTYNAGPDTLTITVDQPIFGPVDTINYQGSNGSGQLNLGSGHFVVDSPTQITVGANANNAGFLLNAPTNITQLDFFSPGPTLIGTWTGTEAIGVGINIASADSTAENRLEITGTGFDTADRMRVIDDFAFNTRYYDPAGPNNGLNPVGAVVVWTDTLVTITDAGLSGIIVTDIQARDGADAFMDELFTNVIIDGPALTYPILESICSPSADTIRFTGTNFLNATAGPIGYAILRLLDYSAAGPNELQGPAMQYEFADGSPDPVYDWVLVTHTDTVLEISNPRFSLAEPSGGPGDFVVTGVAFHDPTASGFYYYEPWGESFYAPVDGLGCAACSGIGAAVIDPDVPLDNFGDRAAWHPSGNRVGMSVSDTDGVVFYDYNGITLELGGAVDVQTPFDGSNYNSDWSLDGQWFAAGGSSGGAPMLGVYAATGPNPTKLTGPASGLPFTGTVRDVAFHPTLPIFAASFSQAPYLALFEIAAGVVSQVGTIDIAPGAAVVDLSWSPGGEILAVAQQGANGLLAYSFDGVDALSKLTLTMPQPPSQLQAVEFASDYTLAVGTTGGAFLYLYQTVGVDFVAYGTVPNPGGAVRALGWTPAADVLMIAGNAAYSGVGFLSRAGSVFTIEPVGTGGLVSTAYAARYDRQGCAVLASVSGTPFIHAISSE